MLTYSVHSWAEGGQGFQLLAGHARLPNEVLKNSF